MAVPNTFANATTSIPLSQLDQNFATAITLGNTAIQLGNTVTTLNNMTLANVTVSTGNVSFTQGTIGGNVVINTTGTANTGNHIVTGTLSVSGAVTQGGALANYAANFRDGTVGGSCYLQITTNASGNAGTDGFVWGLDTASPPNAYLSQKENANLYLQANSATVATVSSTGLAVTGTITGPTSISIGTNPAATGELRIPNAGGIYSRNAANSANLQIAGFTSADVLQLNNAGLTASVANGATVNLGVLQTGILVVVSNVDFTGVFVLSNSVTYELSDPDNKYSITAGTANSINLYNSGGSVILENNSGGTRSFYITNIK